MKKRLLIGLAFLATVGMTNAQNLCTNLEGITCKPDAGKIISEKQPSFQMAKALMDNQPTLSTRADESAKELTLAYCDQNEPATRSNVRAGVTRMALGIPPKMIKDFAGNKITKIRFGLYDVENTSNISVWITKDLDSNPIVKKAVANVTNGWNEVTLDTPFELDGARFYIGYDVTLNNANGAFPFGVKIFSSPANGCYIYYNNAWDDFTNQLFSGANVTLQMQCVVEGSKMPETNVDFEQVTYSSSIVGSKDIEIAGYITNHGCDVKSMELSYSIGNEAEQSVNATVAPSIRYNGQGIFTFTIPNTVDAGIYDINITINKINGETDTDMKKNTLVTGLTNMQTSFPRKTAVEEGTGNWCGWCIRGIVKMEQMKEKYPDSFVGIAAHWSAQGAADPMQVDDYYPIISQMSGFPNALFDRYYLGDPYEDMDQYFKLSQSTPCEASISLATKYTNDDKTEISVTSNVQFSLSHNSTPYRMAYVVVEDGVTGYKQTNYYNKDVLIKQAGWTQEDVDALEDALQVYVNSPSIINMTFNDVARGIYDCLGIEGSFVGEIKANEAKTHEYTIQLPDNIKNKDNVRIVALLIREATGEIVNAQQVKIGGSITSINNMEISGFSASVEVNNGMLNITANEVATAEIYSINGTQIMTASVNGSATLPVTGLKGVYIVRVNNGKDVVVRKIVL